MKNNEYIIYHIPGKKIGVTNDLYNRVECQQGYEVGEYEILESSDDIDYVSKRELELQKKYGYRVDLVPYNELVNNKKEELMEMKINVTEQTTTFPCPINKLKGRLLNEVGQEWITEHGKCWIDSDSIDWIMKNVSTSMFNTERCYVYNKAMAKHFDSRLPLLEKGECLECDMVTPFDLIRDWADTRGIYEHGDPKTQYLKLMEEAGELGRAILKENEGEQVDAIGDMVVVLTNLSELLGLNIEDCIESAYEVISKRTGKMKNGTFVKDN